MIVLAVITYNGRAGEPVEASFDELGGTIGRADGNLMVLPDPERTISRVHAKVVFRNGQYAVEDRGSNPILVNGNLVGHGKEWPLNPGDVLQIGGYELGVRAGESPAASSDPFADVFGSSGDPLATAPVPPPAFVDAQPATPVPRAARRAPAGGLAALPSDWNPLADDGSATGNGLVPGAGAHGRDPGDLVGVGQAEASIDDLFGLGDGTPKAGSGAGAAWPEGDDDFLGIYDPAGAQHRGVGEPVLTPHKEDARLEHQRNELNAAFPGPLGTTVTPRPPPRAADQAPPVPRGQPPLPPPMLSPVSSPMPLAGVSQGQASTGLGSTTPGVRVAARPLAPEPRKGAVVSWDDGGARQATIVAPVAAGRRAGGPMGTQSGGTRPGIRPGPGAGAGPSAADAAAPAAGQAGGDELLRALLEGLGAGQAPPITRLTPELMRLVGALLAESVRGAVDLLQARAAVKREVRADVTAIRPRQNNPLKFSPNAALALQHVLGPTVPGFMRGEEAMRDAYRDLRAHELAVMAGMRSALAGLLQRFDPKALETRIAGKSGLGLLLAGGRRAQLWESYQDLFGQLSAEAEDDFHAIFGRAFLQAYQEQLDQLAADDGGAR